MKSTSTIGLTDVQAVYDGPEGDIGNCLWASRFTSAASNRRWTWPRQAGIGPGMAGIDLCCCSGAGMRFLVRFRGVARMLGVDATETVVERGRRHCAAEGLADRITFVLADVCQSGLPEAAADFIWGEDAWCYVVDKRD